MRKRNSKPRASTTQYTVPRVQNHGPFRRIQNPTTNAAANPANIATGRTLTAGRPADVRRDIERRRRELQEKYCQEAAEAEEKRVRKEQKKKEEWLKRQESLIRPGHRLGYGTQSSNFRDLVEHQEAIGIDPQEDSPHQQRAYEQFRLLVQQGHERDADEEELKKRIDQLAQEAEKYERQRKQAIQDEIRRQVVQNEMRRAFSNSPRSRNTPRNLPASNSNVASSSTSNANDSENPKKPDNFLGVYRNVSPLASNTNGTENSKKPANFLGVAHNTSPSTTNTNVSSMKPANFLGTVQIASTSTTKTNDARQGMSGHILGSGENVAVVSPTSAACQTEADNRERMRAARLRMQAQYNEEVKKAEQAKDQEEHNLAEGVERISLN